MTAPNNNGRDIIQVESLLGLRPLSAVGGLSAVARNSSPLIVRPASTPVLVVAVALANKMAPIAWALLAKGATYRRPALVAAQ